MSASSGDVISPSEALNVVASFFTDEWPLTEAKDVQVQKISGGYSNINYIVRRSSPSAKEPSAVILRRAIGVFSLKEGEKWKLSPEEETVMYYEMSRRGWGPKVYGISRDYRVLEYIDSHTMTPEDCDDAVICRDVARNYARIHSLDMPFVRSTTDDCIETQILSFPEFKSQASENKATTFKASDAEIVSMSALVLVTSSQAGNIQLLFFLIN